MRPSKTRRGRHQEKRCGLSGLNVSQDSSAVQAEKWPLGLLPFWFLNAFSGAVPRERWGWRLTGVFQEEEETQRENILQRSRDVDSWKSMS